MAVHACGVTLGQLLCPTVAQSCLQAKRGRLVSVLASCYRTPVTSEQSGERASVLKCQTFPQE